MPFMDSIEQLLKDLTEAHGVPGYETPIRAVVRNYLKPLGELNQDKLGSVICTQKGEADKPRVMLAGHMDEIGFMIKQITAEGFLRFLPLGGWFDQVLLGQRVLIKTARGDVTGVIGAKPPHLLTADERSKVIRDLNLAGCVRSVHLVPRPKLANVSQNATGDLVTTDGDLAVVELKGCDPRVPGLTSGNASPQFKPSNHVFRYLRRQILTFRSDIWRANIIYGAYDLVHMGVTALRHHSAGNVSREASVALAGSN